MEKGKILIVNYPSSDKDFRLIILKDALVDLGFDIDFMVNTVWGDYGKKVLLVRRPYLFIGELFKYLAYLFKLVLRIKANQFDFIIVGYPAYVELILLKFLFIFSNKRKSIITDYFISVYDTLVLDRKDIKKGSLLSTILFLFDKALLTISGSIITDTNANSKRYSLMFNVPEKKFKRIFVGSRLTRGGLSISGKLPEKNKVIKIGWVGAIIPLHGVDKIIFAAKLLESANLEFHIIGNGPGNELLRVKEKIKELDLRNVVLYDELAYLEAMKILQDCDLCIGIFGDSEKAKSVIPFKVFDYLSLNKYLITQQSDALEEISAFKNIRLVENTSEALARAIEETVNENLYLGPFNSCILIDELQKKDIERVLAK